MNNYRRLFGLPTGPYAVLVQTLAILSDDDISFLYERERYLGHLFNDQEKVATTRAEQIQELLHGWADDTDEEEDSQNQVEVMGGFHRLRTKKSEVKKMNAAKQRAEIERLHPGIHSSRP